MHEICKLSGGHRTQRVDGHRRRDAYRRGGEFDRTRNLALLARLLEAPPLARALYKSVEIGREVPAALYVSVAQVLTYVYQLRAARERGATPPPPPTIQ